MTAYHAVVGRAKVQRGDTVLLLGLGGLGFNALQIILHLGARAVVVDQRQVVLDEAVSFGVDPKDVVPVGTPDVGEWLKAKGLRVDIAIDFVAVPATFKAAVDSGEHHSPCVSSKGRCSEVKLIQSAVRPDGTVVVVGLLSPELSFRGPAVVRKQISILGSYGGTCSDIEACLDLIAKGKLVPQVTTGSLKDFPQLLEDLHEGKIKSRIALIPEGMEEQ
jgi:propanol-preferring alcohol dehydrogenase